MRWRTTSAIRTAAYRQLSDLAVDRDGIFDAAKAPTWAGYFGAPRLATAEIGRFLFETKTAEHVKLAMRILDGFDERSVPRYADVIFAIPAARAVSERALEQERARAKRQQDWMDKNARR
jgi:hypothetical protein